MAKKTKTFKIGEYAVGGVVKVTLDGSVALVQCLSWGSKQVVLESEQDIWGGLQMWLEVYVTTNYYAERIMDWVKKNCY